jgi:hypothetical protein
MCRICNKGKTIVKLNDEFLKCVYCTGCNDTVILNKKEGIPLFSDIPAVKSTLNISNNKHKIKIGEIIWHRQI